jgi:hypothetical protein
MKRTEELLEMGHATLQVRLSANLVLAIEAANWTGDLFERRQGYTKFYRPYDFERALRRVLPPEVLERAQSILDRQATVRRRTVTSGSASDSWPKKARRGP